MTSPMWSGTSSRKIESRIVIEGDLELQTPAHFGNGDGDDLTDMPLFLDPYDEAGGKTTPLLTGASIAGALRSYLRELEHGYKASEKAQSASAQLFGAVKGDDDGEQSPLIIDDAFGTNGAIEMRDGVKIDVKSRTAEDKKKFDLQLWQAGTKFTLRFELLIRKVKNKEEEQKAYEESLKQALATALKGFEDGSITLGARKRRGYGRVNIIKWRMKGYALTSQAGLFDWLENGNNALPASNEVIDIARELGVTSLMQDHRKIFDLAATFSLDESLLIRSGSNQDFSAPDMVHLHTKIDGSLKPILSGTSLGGALRARGLKIANTISKSDQQKSKDLIDDVFGREMKGDVQPCASRVLVEEKVVEQPADAPQLVQNRVSLDRFTGGARDTALFNEQPVFGGHDTIVKLKLSLFDPACHEIGLLLLLLKDLWTGDLPLGGESSVGRGRLQGKDAKLTYRFDGKELHWVIKANAEGLEVEGDKTVLESYVSMLQRHLGA